MAATTSPPTTDVGFVQQGQVDWVSFTQKSVALSIDILARFQGAGVQEITYAGSLQLVTRFSLSHAGQERVWSALQKLGVYSGYANALYFGFGHRSFLRFLSETISGLKCIALCSCLTEMHSEDVAARVLAGLWKAFEFPEHIEPSLGQFKALIKACAGAVAKSPFSTIGSRMLGHHMRPDQKSRVGCSEPQDIADTLLGLFEISTGLRSRIRVFGGAECSFIAAMAVWLFDFKTYVEDSAGNVLFQTSTDAFSPDSAQVHIRYTDSDELSKVVLSSSDFILRNPGDMVVHTPDERLHLLRTRINWDECLEFTFGHTFKELMKAESDLGEVLGGAARIYLALADGEPDVCGQRRGNFVNFVETSYGRGLIKSVGDIFPELAGSGLGEVMKFTLTKTVQHARSAIERAILSLKSRCHCATCSGTSFLSRGEEDPDCLLVLAATLLELVTTIANVETEPESDIRPTVKGLRLVYEQVQSRVYPSRGIPHCRILYSPKFNDVLGTMNMFSRSLIIRNTIGTLMANVLCVFTGYKIAETEQRGTFNYRTAVSHDGICIYMDILATLSTRAELLRKIHVVPGHIEYRSRRYDSIWDGAPRRTLLLEPVDFTILDASDNGLDSAPPPSSLSISPLVTEPSEAGQLAFSYQITTPRGTAFIQPGWMTCLLLEATGQVSCTRRNCDTTLSAPCYLIRSGWSIDDTTLAELASSETTVCVWKQQSDAARMLELEILGKNSVRGQIRGQIVLRRDECLSCCTRSHVEEDPIVKREARYHVYHII